MKRTHKRILVHIGLFIVTFFCTTFAGSEWTIGKSILLEGYTIQDFVAGLHFSVPFLLVLTVHEFGHYFTARHYKVETSLPYYIPIPPMFLSIGTMGAIIRMRSRVQSRKEHFDIGIAGPLAGFVVAIALLIYGFTHLPPPEHIFTIHPEYEQYGLAYEAYVYQPQEGRIDVVIGTNMLMEFLGSMFADPERIPNAHELMHYPYLFAGFLALFITGINLIPVGQLDGGHILYGLLGYNGHKKVASAIFILFITFSGLGLSYINPHINKIEELGINIPLYILFLFLCFSRMFENRWNTIMVAVLICTAQFALAFYFPEVRGFSGWLLFGFVIGRLIGVHHPRARIETPLDIRRKILGWIALLIFVLCISLQPIDIIGI